MQLNQDSRIYVAGHRGLVGAAVVRTLQQQGYRNLLLRTHQELDLTDQGAVRGFFDRQRPMAHRSGVAKLVFLGSSCIYPKLAPQPIKEDYLLTGPLEPTNEAYAIAKIAGVKMCQAYRREFGFNAISLMPTNLYGPGDNFDLQNSHVLPALIRRFHEAKLRGDESMSIWGTGTPRREFLHVDDLADAVVYLLKRYDDEAIVNIGWGEDVTIRELAELVMSVSGFQGRLMFDASKPDGTPRKLLDTTRLTALGWRPKIPLKAGIESTYAWFREHVSDARL